MLLVLLWYGLVTPILSFADEICVWIRRYYFFLFHALSLPLCLNQRIIINIESQSQGSLYLCNVMSSTCQAGEWASTRVRGQCEMANNVQRHIHTHTHLIQWWTVDGHHKPTFIIIKMIRFTGLLNHPSQHTHTHTHTFISFVKNNSFHS